MIAAGLEEKIYPVGKIALLVNALEEEGVSLDNALESVGVSAEDLRAAQSRISLHQAIQCCRYVSRLSADPSFAYRTGLRCHVSALSMYGFALLASTDFRECMKFAEHYQSLATPLVEFSFREEGDCGVWTLFPVSHPDIDAVLYRFLIEFQFGIAISLHRDVMGSSFGARELQVVYDPPGAANAYEQMFGCPVRFGRAANAMLFDRRCLDRAPELGNELTYSEVIKLCDQLVEEMELRVGVAGKVREVLLANLGRSIGLELVATKLKLPVRTLRRRLAEEGETYRQIVDELRTRMAIKYLRQTDLTNDEIAMALGFSDAASFQHAFKRWTGGAPNQFRTGDGGRFDQDALRSTRRG